jgi:GAF domain-containing protein
MKTGQPFRDLLVGVGRALTLEAGMNRALKALVVLSGATAGGLCFHPDGSAPLLAIAGTRRGSALDSWLRSSARESVKGTRVDRLAEPPPGWRGRRGCVALRVALGDGAGTGTCLLLGGGGRRSPPRLPAGFAREIGLEMEAAWRRERRELRLQGLRDITAVVAATTSLERIYHVVADAVGRLIRFDELGVTLVDRERTELRVLDVAAPTPLPYPHELRITIEGALETWIADHRTLQRIDDASEPAASHVGRELMVRRGSRSAVMAPLIAQGELIGTLNVTHEAPGAFTADDAELLNEAAQPLASAIERTRLREEIGRRAEELAALNRTSQLITARLDLGSVLETISRSVTSLMGSTGCGIGLFNADRSAIDHVAAHGFRAPEWSTLTMPVGQGIIGRAAASGKAIRSDDLALDPRSARRDVDQKEGIRAMLCVPLRVAGEIIGVISAFSMIPGFFTARHQTLLEGFADQAGVAIQNARLFEESQRRARETQALLEAGHAVNQSLDVSETIELILNQAREVLGVQSCGLFTLDPATGELQSAASLDLEPVRGRIRIKVGEGITGSAVKLRRPVQSSDLDRDPRVRYRQLPAGSGLRSLLAAPLLVGDQAIGALTVLRSDVHHFTPEEESLVSAFADQAAMALEHARLFSSVRTYSEQLEAMVTARTQELDEQKRFVEVVLETLPLGLFVLDRGFIVVSANREGAALLPFAAGPRVSFLDLLPISRAAGIRTFLEAVVAARAVRQMEEEIPNEVETRTVRLTAAPLRGSDGDPTHCLVLVEDITLGKRLERQMLLTERLSTAGGLAAGVAHELNNPLATIAGCAEALKERAQNPELAEHEGFKDFPSYLSLIEEEAYRCKEITGNLLQFVREPGSRRVPTDVNLLVEKSLELLRHQPRFAGSRFLTDLDPAVPLLVANEGRLRQVFLGLSANALEAMEGRGKLTVRTRRRDPAEIEIAFEDEGPGIADEVLPRVFDPFFTTKPPGQGTGLGLAIAQGIVADHGGRIEVTTRVGAGSTFRVILAAAGETEGTTA